MEPAFRALKGGQSCERATHPPAAPKPGSGACSHPARGLQGTISIWLPSVLVSATASWVKLLTTDRNFKTPGSRQKQSPSPPLPSLSPFIPCEMQGQERYRFYPPSFLPAEASGMTRQTWGPLGSLGEGPGRPHGDTR